MFLLLFLILPVFVAAEDAVTLTCDPARIQEESYRLSVQEQAAITLKNFPKFIVWPEQAFDEQARMMFASLLAAEKSQSLDPANAYSANLLARLYLVPNDTYEKAKHHWKQLFDHDIGLSFLSLIYDVDTKRYFIAHLKKDALSFYPANSLGLQGLSNFPGPSNETFWRSVNGCLPEDLKPAGKIPWSDITEIKVGNWVHWFELSKPVQFTLENGKTKTLKKLKVFFAGGVGRVDYDIDWYAFRNKDFFVKTSSHGPKEYNTRFRRVLLETTGLQGKIKAPDPKDSDIGW